MAPFYFAMFGTFYPIWRRCSRGLKSEKNFIYPILLVAIKIQGKHSRLEKSRKTDMENEQSFILVGSCTTIEKVWSGDWNVCGELVEKTFPNRFYPSERRKVVLIYFSTF